MTSINLDFINKGFRGDHLPPLTVFVRVLRELEEDFTHYNYKGYEPIRFLSFHRTERNKRSIYTELGDRCKIMDAALNVVNVYAQQ